MSLPLEIEKADGERLGRCKHCGDSVYRRRTNENVVHVRADHGPFREEECAINADPQKKIVKGPLGRVKEVEQTIGNVATCKNCGEYISRVKVASDSIVTEWRHLKTRAKRCEMVAEFDG